MWGGAVGLMDSPSAGSCLIPASLLPVQNSFLHREMGDSDGCWGNGDSAKPFPFSEKGRGGGAFATEVVAKSSTNMASGLDTQETDYSLLFLDSDGLSAYSPSGTIPLTGSNDLRNNQIPPKRKPTTLRIL